MPECSCACCQDFRERRRCGADTRWACDCADRPEEESCVCAFCRSRLADGLSGLEAMRTALHIETRRVDQWATCHDAHGNCRHREHDRDHLGNCRCGVYVEGKE